jgi:hypothetical protein
VTTTRPSRWTNSEIFRLRSSLSTLICPFIAVVSIHFF